MDYYNLGLTSGKAWRLGHTEATRYQTQEAEKEAFVALHIPMTTSNVQEFGEGFTAGVSSVDENAGQVSQPEPLHAEALTPDGDTVSLHIDPESEHRYVVGLHPFGMRMWWATETEAQAHALFYALQHVQVLDED